MTTPNTTTQIWKQVRAQLTTLFTKDIFDTWFSQVDCLREEEHELVLGVPSEFTAIWIQENYLDMLQKLVNEIAGGTLDVTLEVTGEEPVMTPTTSSRMGTTGTATDRSRETERARESRYPRKDQTLINPRNTFDHFVVGAGNQLAHAACVAVANAPAKAYNPLFLYGDTGLGKTHLMHAVAHHILQRKPDAQVAYVSTEKFTNNFIRALQENRLVDFRRRYRHVDILLIDDIHFLSGKERIQEEFFHTFNELFESQKQIILSSDRPANEISKLESRLVSRFQWGLVTDIQAPDLETRMAILGSKARAMNLHLEPDILQFLAERVSRNVRRMEGALTRVGSYSALVGGTLDLTACERLLQDILQEEAQNQVTIDKIQKRVADYFNIRLQDMTSKRRPANIAFPRQIAMYLSRMLTSKSLQEIGATFGGRDHGTVIHACKTVENMMEQDESVQRSVEYLQKQLAN